MVTLDYNATMRCDEAGCSAHTPVLLALSGTGGFVFKPITPSLGWQVGLSGNMGGPFITRCPEHKTLVAAVAPVIQGVSP